jgi:hypothetical protein
MRHPSPHRQPGQPLFAVGPEGFDREERSNGLSLSAPKGGEGTLSLEGDVRYRLSITLRIEVVPF